MSSGIRRVYWDTGLFICFLNAKENDRRDICEDVLKHARDGRIEIYTSMWTIVEVVKPKGSPAPLTEAQAAKIAAMFKWEWLHKVQVHEGVAFRAAEVARLYGLKPADAIHAATAIMLGVDAMQVWDRDFSKVASLVTIEQPKRLTAQMPLIDVVSRIGPTPEDFEPTSPASTATAPPSGQSPGDGSPKASQPAPVLPAAPQGDPERRPQGSSRPAAPPPPSKK